jgi:hypothetical protein
MAVTIVMTNTQPTTTGARLTRRNPSVSASVLRILTSAA